MRTMRIVLTGLTAVFLAATQGLTQFEGKPFGRSSRSADPDQMFNSLANGKEVLVRSEMSPAMQHMFDRIAEKMGITNGQITRQQFTAHTRERMLSPGTPGGEPGTPALPVAPAVPGGLTPPDPNMATWAEETFRRLDLNGDGSLSFDEMPDDLRAERAKWDTDRNGLIDLNEFKAYFYAKTTQRMAERSEAGLSMPWQGRSGTPGVPQPAPAPEKRKPLVYHSGNLPTELPSWFKQLDINHDAQISLHEWRISGRSVKEFLEMDRNNDGFLTVEEVLHHQAQKGKKGAGPVIVKRPVSPEPVFSTDANGRPAPPDLNRFREKLKERNR